MGNPFMLRNRTKAEVFNYDFHTTGAKTTFWMLCDYPYIDVDRGLLTLHNYITVDRDLITHFYSPEYATRFFNIAHRLQQCHLTTDQVNAIRALVIFNPGT